MQWNTIQLFKRLKRSFSTMHPCFTKQGGNNLHTFLKVGEGGFYLGVSGRTHRSQPWLWRGNQGLGVGCRGGLSLLSISLSSLYFKIHQEAGAGMGVGALATLTTPFSRSSSLSTPQHGPERCMVRGFTGEGPPWGWRLEATVQGGDKGGGGVRGPVAVSCHGLQVTMASRPCREHRTGGLETPGKLRSQAGRLCVQGLIHAKEMRPLSVTITIIPPCASGHESVSVKWE